MTSELRAMTLSEPAFWRRLNPHLSIGHTSEPMPIRVDLAPELVRFLADGYLASRPTLPPAVCWPLALAVRRICAAGLPAAFAMVYDQFWSLLIGAAEGLAPLLGPSPRLVPDFWIRCVEPGSEPSTPSRGEAEYATSSFREDGRPTALMISLPLTDAGNGDPSCIYVLPAGTDPFRPGPVDRPPPYRGWRAPRSSPAHQPRISVAAWVQSSDVEPVDRFEIGTRFEARLAAIGRAILRHRDASAGIEIGVSSALLAACRRWWTSACDATACPAGV